MELLDFEMVLVRILFNALSSFFSFFSVMKFNIFSLFSSESWK